MQSQYSIINNRCIIISMYLTVKYTSGRTYNNYNKNTHLMQYNNTTILIELFENLIINTILVVSCRL